MTDETEAPDLKPCPFCGSENLGKLRRSPFQSEASIMCNDCYSSSASTEKWNIRADLSDAKDKRIAELEVKLATLEANLADADAWVNAALTVSPNIDLDIEAHARTTLTELKGTD